MEYEEKIRFLLLLRNLILNDFEEAEHLAYLEPYPYRFEWVIKADIWTELKERNVAISPVKKHYQVNFSAYDLV